MTQRDQVIQVMETLGGFATLMELYENVDTDTWKTGTSYASIRRIVQENKYFFRIKPGLWGLNTHRKKLAKLIGKTQTIKKRNELDHYYYQGLLLEIGNNQKYQTFAPYQDKNKKFLRASLGEVQSLKTIHKFSYADTVRRAQTIDVTWFNKRNMPYAFFEVEHSTDFTNSLSKYIALQDFNAKFFMVSNKTKRREFDSKILRQEFHSLKSRVNFIDYEKLARWHSNSMEANHFRDMP